MRNIHLTEDHVDALFTREDADDGRALISRVPVRVLRAETGRDFSGALVSVGTLTVEVEMTARDIETWCSHDGQARCAHGAAAIIALADDEQPFGIGAVGRSDVPAARPTSEPWERTLRRLLPDDESPTATRELALLFSIRESGAGDPPGSGVAIRPAVRGSGSGWVRTGVSWRALADADDADPRRRALADIAALHDGRYAFADVGERIRRGSRSATFGAGDWGSPEWIRLDAVPSRGLWSALVAAHDAGVEFVADDTGQPTVEVGDTSAKAIVDLRDVSGRLRVEATVAGPPGEGIRPIGAPTSAVARVHGSPPRVRALVPLARPATREWDALFATGRLSIPAGSVDDFRDGYLPRLRDVGPLVSTDESFEVPPAARGDLVLAIRHTAKTVRVHWEWEYPPGERRDRAAERVLLSDVETTVGRFRHLLGRRAADGVFPTRDLDPDETVEFLAHALPALRGVEGVRIETHNDVPELTFATENPVIEIGAEPSGEDWFELNVVVTIQGEPVSSAALLTALSHGRTYFRLLSGTVFPLTDPRFTRLRDVLAEAKSLRDDPSGSFALPRFQLDLWQELAEIGVLEAQHAAWVEAMSALDGTGIERRDPPASVAATLREYQRDGFSWLDFLRRNRLGGVLADDMGLGKTVQLLAALEQARLDEPAARFLVVAPTSVVGHWAAEAARFVPDLATHAIRDTSRKRGVAVEDAIGDATLVVTSYAILRLDADEFRSMGFRVLVLDEAQNVKNPSSRGHAAARMLGAPSTFVVTGTPLENNLMELFALTTLAAPGLFGTRTHFREHFSRAIEKYGDAGRLERLRARIRPFLLRRRKEEVAPELPAKTEQVLEVPLHGAHQRAYERRFRREQQKLLGLLDDVKKNQIQILASLTRLRREALDPSFGDAAEAPNVRSAKLEALGDLLDEIVADGHRALVFSQFTDFLGLAAGVADRRGVRYSYLDGRTGAAQRTRMVERFQTGEDPAFFISLKAGGTGLTLTGADYCILLDPWWNPAAEEQAIDRTHRIGQDKPIMVYRIIAAGTIEEKVRDLQLKKRRLFHDVLDSAGAPSFDVDDYRALIT